MGNILKAIGAFWRFSACSWAGGWSFAEQIFLLWRGVCRVWCHLLLCVVLKKMSHSGALPRLEGWIARVKEIGAVQDHWQALLAIHLRSSIFYTPLDFFAATPTRSGLSTPAP